MSHRWTNTRMPREADRESNVDLDLDRDGRAGGVVALPRPETGREEGAVLTVLAVAAIFSVGVLFSSLHHMVEQAPRIAERLDGFRPTFVKHVLVSMPTRRPTPVPPETAATSKVGAALMPVPAG